MAVKDALQTALEIGITSEEAIALHKRGLDLSKLFDSIARGLMDGLAEAFGCLTPIVLQSLPFCLV